MLDSLCGHHPCPSICVRVCHCPTGLARSHYLAGMLRNRRLALRGGLRPPRVFLPDHSGLVEFTPEHKHSFSAANQPQRKKLSQPAPPGIDPTTGEIHLQRYRLGQLKETALSNIFGRKQTPLHSKPITFGTRTLKLWSSTNILIGFLLFMGILIGLGLLIWGPSLHPHYGVPNIITWES